MTPNVPAAMAGLMMGINPGQDAQARQRPEPQAREAPRLSPLSYQYAKICIGRGGRPIVPFWRVAWQHRFAPDGTRP